MLKHWQGRPVSEWAEMWGIPFLEVYRRISSTSDRLIDLVEAEPASFSVVIADEQTAGRGRTGRKWYSPDGVGLLMSVLLPASSASQPCAPLIVGVAVARAIEVWLVVAQLKSNGLMMFSSGEVRLLESFVSQQASG